MDRTFHMQNRARFYAQMKPQSLLVLFSGEEIRKTNDEYYPFFADRSFVYMTGIEEKCAVLLAVKDGQTVTERLYIQPSDPMAERWTGRRIKPQEAEAASGIADVRVIDQFAQDFHTLAAGGHYSILSGHFEHVYLDLFRVSTQDIDRPAHMFLRTVQSDYPYLRVENANEILRSLRLIKQPCEIEATKKAEIITGEGILRMMKASRPGMYEYQYKAEFDYALSQHGPQGPGFPSIISAGQNNFCIHYYSYTGQAHDGDMILNDVGAQYDNHITDVSRGWPCSGRFTEKQKLLYECALATSDHMFSIIRPGMKMQDVDATIRRYNAERLRDAGVLKDVSEIGTYMWHGGAHHVGYDVHDVVARPETVAPGMIFCVDVGIYHEEWGIGFRLEDNCLVTENGCENLSAAIPRTVYDIENVMSRG
ncbi:MAG: aminopeptidase P N-terminal domain-containing protein [Clostridia bacterium]|nr:aminopeptidase P N-terminal domain-containing protein [Clostridia bacterium]